MAKREEMVRHFRSTHSTGNASKNVNECSFMKRIVLLSFNGPVLCHMIAPNAVLKLNLLSCIAPMTANLTMLRPRGQKFRAEIDQDNCMAKSPFPHRLFISSNQRTHRPFCVRKEGEELCPGGRKLSKHSAGLKPYFSPCYPRPFPHATLPIAELNAPSRRS